MAEEKKESGWHFEKRISIDGIFIVLQLIAVVVYLTRMDARIERQEENNPVLAKLVESMPLISNRVSMLEDRQISAVQFVERVGKIEAQVMALQQLVQLQSTVINRIDRKLPTFDELNEQQKK